MELFGKEIKYVEKYENDSSFSFRQSNSNWIVYRSQVSMHTTKWAPELVNTIDIIFVGAMYFELLDVLPTVKISKAKDIKSLELASKFDKGFHFLESDERVYKIESQGYSFYIVAAHLWIHEHNCQYRESFIENFNYDQYLSEYVENWIKIK